MEIFYFVESENELNRYKIFWKSNKKIIEDYINFIKEKFKVSHLPKYIVLSNFKGATSCLSQIPIPAFTNDERIVFCPDIEVWKEIYLRQIEKKVITKIAMDKRKKERLIIEIKDYYNKIFNVNHVLQILGHELLHHSNYFFDDFSSKKSNGIWFEEGVVEYISRKYFLTGEEFILEHKNNIKITELFSHIYGDTNLEKFGEEIYGGNISFIFYEYWQAYLKISELVDNADNSIYKVFQEYSNWYENSDLLLFNYFENKIR